MEINKCKKKFKLLFDKFFQENFELSSYYTDNLIKHLENTDDKFAGKILDTPFFSDLVLYSLANLEKTTTPVKCFIMDIFTFAIRNELQFSKLLQMQGFKMLAEKLRVFSLQPPPRLHVAVLRGVLAQTSHYTGIMYVVQNKVWESILRPNIHRRAPKVAHTAYTFIAQLVWKLNEYDEEEALIEILSYIIEPIKTSVYLRTEVIDVENEKDLYEPILTQMNILVAIMRACENPRSNKVLHLLNRHFIVGAPLYIILQLTRNTNLVRLICQFQYKFMIALCIDYLQSGVRGDRDIPNEIISIYYNIFLDLLNKRMTSLAMSFVVDCVVLWAKMDTHGIPNTFERNGRTFETKDQFIPLIICPLVVYTVIVSAERGNTELLEAVDVYTLKMVKLNSELIVKAAYSLRTLMETTGDKKIVIHVLKEMLKLKGYLNIAQAGMMYQALFYTLKLHVITDVSGALILNETPLESPDDVKILRLVLESIKMLLKEHNINWYENVEIISLQSTLVNLLKQNFMPTKQLLQALDLIDLSINKFLSPDMALLMESKTGSTLNEVGVIMQSYIQHEEWEVRDSALSLLLSCINVAFVKYFPLRKLLSENNLMILAAHAGLNDIEFYVQTTALMCLAAATKIESLWREVLIAHPNLYTHLIYIVRNNSEGIVRTAAANVLSEIFNNQKLSKDFISSLYNVMAIVALKDLHWEVQIAALNFWKNVIQNQMSNRGMIEGKFPAVTFSKEKRKIIILNDKEIMKQIVGLVNELSNIGCLTVLLKCLDEEFNVQVMEQAYNIAKDFVTILDYYNFEGVPEFVVPIIVTKAEVDCDNDDITERDIERHTEEEAMDLSRDTITYEITLREKIIDRIENTSDYELLVESNDIFVEIKSDDMDEDLLPPPMTKIEPNKFLHNFKQTDYFSNIENKKNWNLGPRSLDLLLDEILGLGEAGSNVCTDCI